MLLKRSISLFLAMILITQPITVLGSENTNSSDVLLTVDAQVFSAVVPTQLPVNMDSAGVITTASDVSITNTSKGPIRVDKIELTNVKTDWELVNFDSDFGSFKVGSKKLAMSFNGDKSLANGSIVLSTVNLTPIDGLASMALNYEAKIPAQSTGLVDEIPANVVFTLGWDLSTDGSGGSGGSGGSDTAALLLTADKDVLAIDDTSLLTVSQSEPSNVTWENSNPSVAVFEDVLTRSGAVQKTARAIALGKTTIKVTDELGNSATKDIIVIENELASIKITQMPDKTTYNVGDVFNPTGMKLKAVYKLGQEYDLRYYDFDETPIIDGQASVLISYEEQGITKTVNCPISMSSKSLNSISIATPPTKTAYLVGENFSTSGMVVKANYSDSTSIAVTEYIHDGDSLQLGKTDVTITYNGRTVKQAIAVTEIIPEYSHNGFTYNLAENPGKATITGYTGAGGTVVVPATINSVPVILGKTEIKYGPLRYVGPFATNKNIKNLSFQSGVEAPVNADYMFYDFGATTLNLSGLNTVNTTNMNAMFAISAAGSLNLGVLNVSNVTSMGSMFSGSKASSFSFTGWNTSNVEYMTCMFQRVVANSLDLRSFNTSKVVDMESMFAESKASSYYLTSFNTANVTSMDLMFSNTTARTLDLRSFRMLKNRGSAMFSGSSLRTVYAGTQADVNTFDAAAKGSGSSLTVTLV